MQPCSVWSAADIARTKKKSNTCGVWNGADMLTLLKETEFSEPYAVWKAADLLTLLYDKLHNQGHIWIPVTNIENQFLSELNVLI